MVSSSNAGPPDVPQKVKFDYDEVNYNSITLKATSGFYNGAEQTLVVEYKKADNTTMWTRGREEAIGDLKGIEKTLTVENLEDETEYDFRVYAFNTYERSNFTEVITIKTSNSELTMFYVFDVSLFNHGPNSNLRQHPH